MPTLETICRQLRETLADEPVAKAIVFGSFARGTATPQSDLDLVIDSEGRLIGLDFYRVLDKISDAVGLPVDLFETAEIEADSPLSDRIRKEGVVAYERKVV